MLIELLHVSIIAACLAVSVYYGRYMARFQGQKNLLSPIIRPIERGIYWVCGIDESKEMTWKAYLGWYFVFEVICLAFALAILMFQGVLPLNPHGVASFRWDEALNIATSFITNSEWQVYSRERDLAIYRRCWRYCSGLLEPIGGNSLRHSSIPWLCPQELRHNRQLLG